MGGMAVTVERLEVGRRIRELRQRQDISLLKLSALAQVSVGHLSEVERGQSTLTSEKFARVAGALGASSDSLLGGVLGQSDRSVVMPAALAEVSEELGLTYSQTLRLYAAHRSLIPRQAGVTEDNFTQSEWRAFFEKVREFLLPRTVTPPRG
jgi:transcriptional regulator with XRE-family HTH domain